MTTLSEIDGKIDKLFRAGKLNTREHAELESMRAPIFRAERTIEAPKGLDITDLIYWNRRAAQLLGGPVIILAE